VNFPQIIPQGYTGQMVYIVDESESHRSVGWYQEGKMDIFVVEF
jgi:hypothetical protein